MNQLKVITTQFIDLEEAVNECFKSLDAQGMSIMKTHFYVNDGKVTVFIQYKQGKKKK